MPVPAARGPRHTLCFPCRTAIDRTGPPLYFSAMAKLAIIKLPDPILRKVSAPVERVDNEVRKLAADMLETMYAAPGVAWPPCRWAYRAASSCSTRPRARTNRRARSS